jgi:hypothetical protein
VTRSHDYQEVLATSQRVNWRLEDLIGGENRLNFSQPFLPETLARTRPLEFLSGKERLLLNQIRARGYLGLFELVEAFIVPFVSGLAHGRTEGDLFRTAALENFVSEEEKHRKLFATVLAEFDAAFPIRCSLIGPAQEICGTILSHGPMSVTIAILGLEWMSQGHFVDSVRDDQNLDRQFKSLLKYHWLEEAQHAKLDTLLLQSMARGCTPQTIDAAIDEYFEIGAFLDAGLKQQTLLDLQSFEAAAGRSLSDSERERFLAVQHAAQRWTFLGSAMSNRNFLRSLAAVSDTAARRVEQAAASFMTVPSHPG